MEEIHKLQPHTELVVAKLSLVEAIQMGTPWREAAKMFGLSISRTSAYRYRKAYQAQGLAALHDGRQGHPSKLKPAMREWLMEHCQNDPQLTSPQLHKALQAQFGQTLSVSYLDEVRRKLNISRQALSEAGASNPVAKAKKK